MRKIIDIEMLEDLYATRKMSTTEIAKQSEKFFGQKVSPSSVYNTLVASKIPIRSKSESVSAAMSTLDINKSFMNEKMLSFVEGFLLGDGGINFRRKNPYRGARFCIGCKYSDWAIFAMSGFQEYEPSIPKPSTSVKSGHVFYQSTTKTHPDIVAQAKRWYPNGKKKIPKDVKIDPVSLLLWYLGDGSFSSGKNNGNAAKIRLATCGFKPIDIQTILIPKLEKLGFHCKYQASKNEIRICSDSIGCFFDFIGRESPITCYNYKFEVPEWIFLKRLSSFVKNKRDVYRARYYIKTKQVEFSKSPNGHMSLFTDEQAKALLSKLS